MTLSEGLSTGKRGKGELPMRVLLIEDEPTTARAIELMLTTEGFNVYSTDLGEEGLDLGKLYDYDIILLDLNLPDMHGYDVLKKLRVAKVQTPVLILSGISEMDSKVRSFGFGADDYVTKPFSTNVLMAKIKSLLRRTKEHTSEATPETVTTQHLLLDSRSHTCTVDGELVPLTATEFSILWTLASDSGRVFTRTQLISATKGDDYPVTERSIDVQIATIRHKIKKAGPFLKTVWGVGYKYLEEQS